LIGVVVDDDDDDDDDCVPTATGLLRLSAPTHNCLIYFEYEQQY
jgi:hypothetical protein